MADCTTCKAKQQQAEPVPFSAHESDMARMEHQTKMLDKANKRAWLTNIILIIALFIGVIWYIWRDSQYEDVVTTIQAEQETEEGNNYAVVGDLIGTAESDRNG